MRIKMHLLGTGTALLLSVYAVTAYAGQEIREQRRSDRKSTRLNSSHE